MLIQHSTRQPATSPLTLVTNQLRGHILDAGLREGDRLPPERLLAPQLKISRASLRQALAALESTGEVWRHVGRGTFVGAGRHATADNMASHLARHSNPIEVIEARATLEPRLAALAALRGTPKAFAELRVIVDKGMSARDATASHRQGNEFHHAIARMAGNQLMRGLFEAVFEVRDLNSWGKLRTSRSSLDQMRGLWEQHSMIADAIVRRDAHDAEALMRQHIDQLHHAISAQDAQIDASRLSQGWLAGLGAIG
jgi:DNA-binding FadR family transcriptional regulator